MKLAALSKPQHDQDTEILTAAQNNSYPAPSPAIDYPKELGIDIAELPMTLDDPLGWVERVANVYWEPVKELLEAAYGLSPDIPYDQLPGTPLQREWAKYDLASGEWLPVELEEFPQLLLGCDIESVREGKETPTKTDPYRPFLCGFMGFNPGDTHYTWYCWRDHLTGEPLPEVVPFPQDRVVVNQNLVGYDRRYFSCEYEQAGPSSNIYLDTRVLAILMHGVSDQTEAQYKALIKAQAEFGAGVPYWVSHTSPSGLKDLVKFRLGIDINKAVRDSFEKLTRSELAEIMYSTDNLEITPTSTFTYWAQDVHYTTLLWWDLYQEFDTRFVSHPATYSGICLLSQVRLDVSGLDDFIAANEKEYEETVERDLRAVVRDLQDNVLQAAEKIPSTDAYLSQVLKLHKIRTVTKRLKQEKEKWSGQFDECVAMTEQLYPELKELALQIEEGKNKVKKAKDGKTLKELGPDALGLVKTLQSRHRELSAQYKEVLAGIEHGEKSRKFEVISKNMQEAEDGLASTRKQLKACETQRKAVAATLPELEAAYRAGVIPLSPALDWGVIGMGDRTGIIKWIGKLIESNHSIGLRESVVIAALEWKGMPIYWQPEEEDPKLGTWVTDEERLPHLGGGARLGSPFCKDYIRFAIGGELTSRVLDKATLVRLFETIDNVGQWISYRSRYKDIYRVETPYGLITTTDVVPGGAVSGRGTSSTFCVAPKSSDKIGSNIKDYFGPGRGRVAVEQDFAAQESKFLAMLSDAFAGVQFHSEWSAAVLKGVKAEDSDIHTLVAAHCQSAVRELAKTDQMFAEFLEWIVERWHGKKLNFTSIYLCGVPKLAQTLIQSCGYPTELATFVAQGFMDYIKGVDGIALDEFQMLSRCAKLSGYRTAALGRKIADSVDYAHCPNDFHTTRANWTIQSGCVDLLHITVTTMWALIQEHELDAYLMLTVHDSVTYSVLEKDVPLFLRLLDYAHATAKQCAHQGATAWARELRQVPELPQLWCPDTDIYFEKE